MPWIICVLRRGSDRSVLDRFDVLMLKIIFKKWKNITGMYFAIKNYLKNNRYHTVKYVFNPSKKLEHFLICGLDRLGLARIA